MKASPSRTPCSTTSARPIHLNSPLHPFIEQFEISAGFARDDEPEQQLEKLEAALEEQRGTVAETASLFAALLSLPAGALSHHFSSRRAKQKEKTLEALGRTES